MKKLDRKQMAARVARDIPEGAYVNLGIGLPTLVADFLPKGREIILHSENGILGVGPKPRRGRSGRGPDQRRQGAGDAARRRRIFPPRRFLRHDPRPPPGFRHPRRVPGFGERAISPTGTPAAPDAIPAVGGAMDLAVGAKKVLVMMEHLTKEGKSKIVERCTYPLTGARCVDRIYTDLAVIDVKPDGLHVVEMVEGLDRSRSCSASPACR